MPGRFFSKIRFMNSSARVLAQGDATILVDTNKEINRVSHPKSAVFRLAAGVMM